MWFGVSPSYSAGFWKGTRARGARRHRSEPPRRRAQVQIAAQADRRYSGFTCYAALSSHRASNIEDVSYQILLGEKKSPAPARDRNACSIASQPLSFRCR